jgi:hypothetical protein
LLEPEQYEHFRTLAAQEAEASVDFDSKSESYIVHAIVELGYQIESKNSKLQVLARRGQSEQQLQEQVAAAEHLSNSKLQLLHYQLIEYYKGPICSPLKSLDYLRTFIEGEPLHKLSQEQMAELKTAEAVRSTCFDKFHRFHHKLLRLLTAELKPKNCDSVSKSSRNLSELKGDGLALFGLLQRWLQLTAACPGSLLLSNYLQTTQIVCEFDPAFAKANQEAIYPQLRLFMKQLSDSTLNTHFSIIEKIVAYDEQLTYELLTTQTVMTTLLAQQPTIRRLIEEFTPLLEFGIEISHFTALADKQQFIEEVLLRFSGQSPEQLQRQTAWKSELKVRNVMGKIDTILGLDNGNEAVEYVKPYLQELKYLWLLLEGLKDNIHHRNIGRSEHEQYAQFETVAQYFSASRKDCPIYELKAQILLFITLFKLGYHAPTYREDQKVVDLRNHILNLYSKIYATHSLSHRSVLLSRLSSDILRKKSSNEHYHHFEPSLQTSRQSHIWHSEAEQSEEPSEVTLAASFTLTEQIERFISHLSNKVDDLEVNCKKYLANLMNLLESELFKQEKQHDKESAAILT